MEYKNILAILCASVLFSCGDDNQTIPDPHQPYQPNQGVPLSCVPNLDGKIEASEMKPVYDQAVSFLVSPALPAGSTEGRDVNVAGTVQSGKLVWDWSDDNKSDQVASISAQAIEGKWFASSFPNGKFTAPADLSGRLLAIYSYDDNALHLHGIASIDENPSDGKTLLVYDTPISLFPYPLVTGKTWTQTANVKDGYYQGLTPWSQQDTYECEVDGSGELRLPDFTFSQVLRVRTKVTVKPLAGSKDGYTQRQTIFLFECFGEVARATSFTFKSDADDPGKDFTNAWETRKLGMF
jgi:hypothetical protein